ncbi:YehR family protein [Gemelliphila palaticanis]|uniref:YehR family protein n=1 Tax=Gemelliphila palaticanis TaxID=81950 RepID=A0ABX2T0T4_9BACL|nr:YehR family protein [Gemella palaticanis]MBF0715119.1 YehR family protein [Gemella palaticanis]NYS47049.1 YehR family protein [Gemella palaticanis]
MKKNIFLSAVVATAITLTGCSSNSRTENSNSEQAKKEENKIILVNESKKGVKAEITFYYDGDIVTRQDAKNIMTYKDLNMTKDQLKAIIDPLSEKYKATKGVTQNVEFGETEAVETVSVDYSTVDIKELRQLTGSSFTGDENATAISLKTSVEMLKQQGFTEK